jgi:dienelactone hydrolase
MENRMKISDKARRLAPICLIVVTGVFLGLHLGLIYGPSAVERVTIVDGGDGWVVQGDLYVPRAVAKPCPAVIVSHGYGGDRSTLALVASGIAEKGIIVLSIDFWGRGTSWPNMTTQLHDYKTAYYYLCNRSDVDASRIGAAGHSLGGAISMWSAFTLPLKSVVSIGYTWMCSYYLGFCLNSSYPANILFVTGTMDDKMMRDLPSMMEAVTGISNPQEDVLYGNIGSLTAREFKTVNSGHSETNGNIEAIDATAAWFDMTLNGETDPEPTFIIAKYISLLGGVVCSALVAAWFAFVTGRWITTRRGETAIPQRLSAQPATKKRLKHAPREVLLKVLKGVIFASLYIACWLPAFVLYKMDLGQMLNVKNASDQVLDSFPFITGLQTSEVLVILIATIPPLVGVVVLTRFLFAQIEKRNQKPTVDQVASIPIEAEHAMPLREPGRILLDRFLGGAAVLGIIVGGLLSTFHISVVWLIPIFPNQWLTFLLLWPFTIAFSLGDQVWFGAVVQRKSAFQKNRKMAIAFLAALVVKASIIGAFLSTGSIDYILPLLILLVLSLPFNAWLTQFFKSIYPGVLVTGTFMALIIPTFSFI